MFNIPKDADFGDDFDDAALEDELHAIISGNHPPPKSSRTSNNSVNQERFAQAASNNAPVGKRNEPPASRPVADANPYDLNALMGNLNLETADDEDELDENDPELNAQLAAFLGDEDLPSYSPKKPTTAVATSQPSSTVAKPSRPAPVPVIPAIPNRPAESRPVDASCIQLDNSHFSAKPSPPPQQQFHEQESVKLPTSTSQIEQLRRLKDEYKVLALNAKKANEIETAKEYLKKMREVETALESMRGGDSVGAAPSSKPASVDNRDNRDNRPTEEPVKQAGSLQEELEQRRKAIEQCMAKEQSMNNVPKVKMMTRVIKQYDTAIKAAKSGRQFDYASLPPAPGFGELSLERFSKPAGGAGQATSNAPTSSAAVRPPQTEPVNKPASSQDAQIRPSVQPSPSPSPQANSQTNNQVNNQVNKIRQLEKQRDEYKMLALNAKKQNDIETAKQYLLKMKEISALIENLSGGQQTHNTTTIEPARPAIASASILQELEQRKTKFNDILQRENAQNNASRVRVIGRVVKQYETAIGACKTGREFDYEALPIPPGFEQLPKTAEAAPRDGQPAPPKPAAPVARNDQKAQAPAPPAQQSDKPPFKRSVSINNKQLDYLLQRQKLFKEAAVESNKKGDTTQALDYLRKAKGFAPLITAVENGLPIDVSNIPIPPQIDSDDFVMVTSESSGALSGVDLEKEEHYRKLELELEKQIGLCAKNKDHFYQVIFGF